MRVTAFLVEFAGIPMGFLVNSLRILGFDLGKLLRTRQSGGPFAEPADEPPEDTVFLREVLAARS